MATHEVGARGRRGGPLLAALLLCVAVRVAVRVGHDGVQTAFTSPAWPSPRVAPGSRPSWRRRSTLTSRAAEQGDAEEGEAQGPDADESQQEDAPSPAAKPPAVLRPFFASPPPRRQFELAEAQKVGGADVPATLVTDVDAVRSLVSVKPIPEERLAVEEALGSDSLRTLLCGLDDARGAYPVDRMDRDKTRRPILTPKLTIRALLRFAELRHGSTDDLVDSDWVTKCGNGVRALMIRWKHCRDEVSDFLEGRPDDVMRIARAFHDLPFVIKRYKTLFTHLFEHRTAELIKSNVEPLGRLLSFMEPFYWAHANCLFYAVYLGVIRTRLDEIGTEQLLEAVDLWYTRARDGTLDIDGVTANRVRYVVTKVALMDLAPYKEQRTKWFAAALWGSVSHEKWTADLQVIEKKILRGFLLPNDAAEVLSLALELSHLHHVESNDLFKLFEKYLYQAFAKASPARKVEVLANFIQRRQMFQNVTAPLQRVLVKASVDLVDEGTARQVEQLLEAWVQAQYDVIHCPLAMTQALVRRVVPSEAPPGDYARSCEYLSRLKVVDGELSPLFRRMLGVPIALDELQPLKYGDPVPGYAALTYFGAGPGTDENCTMQEGFHLLARLYFPQGYEEEQPPPPLAETDDIFRLVGPPPPVDEEAVREADASANHLQDLMSSQLPLYEDELGATILAWRVGSATIPLREDEEGSLSRIVCPFIIRGAREGAAIAAASETAGIGAAAEAVVGTGAAAAVQEALQGTPSTVGDIARATALLANTMNGEGLGLVGAEWSLRPFARAAATEVDVACEVVSEGCAATGAPKQVIENAAHQFVDSLCPAWQFDTSIAYSAIDLWQHDPEPLETGLELLKATIQWLDKELDQLATVDDDKSQFLFGSGMDDFYALSALQSLDFVVKLVEGEFVPTLRDITKFRDFVGDRLDGSGQALVADAVAKAWGDHLPGIMPKHIATYFSMFWRRELSSQTFLDQITTSSAQDLMAMRSLRAQKTWGASGPPGGFFPAWRMRGEKEVPWFMSDETYDEVEQDEGKQAVFVGYRQNRLFIEGEEVEKVMKDYTGSDQDDPLRHFLPRLTSMKYQTMALDRCAGRCIYCGSAHNLKSYIFVPASLGAQPSLSNCMAACGTCYFAMKHLGLQRFSRALRRPVDEAGEVWWQAQRAANVKYASFLGALNS